MLNEKINWNRRRLFKVAGLAGIGTMALLAIPRIVGGDVLFRDDAGTLTNLTSIVSGPSSVNDNSVCLFNGTTGRLIQEQKNVDVVAYIGRAIIGHASYNDQAAFSHHDMSSAGQYALIQGATGFTILNCAAGRNIYFRVNNVTEMSMDSGGLNINDCMQSASIKTDPHHAQSEFGTYTDGGSDVIVGYVMIHDDEGTGRPLAVSEGGC